MVYRLNPYVDGIYGYAPFFIFPHHRTIILSETVLKLNSLTLAKVVAHELGHIQGGLKHLGPVTEMEKYADDFADKVTTTKPQKEPQ